MQDVHPSTRFLYVQLCLTCKLVGISDMVRYQQLFNEFFFMFLDHLLVY